MRTRLLFLLIGCFAGVSVCAAQDAAQNGALEGVVTLDMDKRVLQEKYQIAPTKDGLIGALRHERSEVRTFAAITLAEDGQKDAIGPILAALAVEPVKGNKVILATSAAQLGSEEGTAALENMCQDSSWSPAFRMIAAQSMITFLGREECLTSVLDVLRAPGDFESGGNFEGAALALSMLPRFRHIPAAQLQEIRDLCAMYLRNDSSALRTLASHYIRRLGDAWAISQLRAAVDAEPDEMTRKTIAADLAAIQGR